MLRKRNPIHEPNPGDILQLGKVRVRVLPCKVAGEVFYELRGKPCQIDKLGWITWCDAMEAKVITK